MSFLQRNEGPVRKPPFRLSALPPFRPRASLLPLPASSAASSSPRTVAVAGLARRRHLLQGLNHKRGLRRRRGRCHSPRGGPQLQGRTRQKEKGPRWPEGFPAGASPQFCPPPPASASALAGPAWRLHARRLLLLAATMGLLQQRPPHVRHFVGARHFLVVVPSLPPFCCCCCRPSRQVEEGTADHRRRCCRQPRQLVPQCRRSLPKATAGRHHLPSQSPHSPRWGHSVEQPPASFGQ